MNKSGTVFIIFLMVMLNVLPFKECGASDVDGREVRAVWLHQTLFDKEEATAGKQIADLFDAYADAGINHLYDDSPFELSNDCGSMLWCEWIRWNQQQVTALVRDVHHLIQASGKKVLLGADVFPSMDISPVEIGQKWTEWAQEGIIDFLVDR
ncbi:MAG TPA: hypothetical protein PKH94_06005 [Bacteroidales bacterium]|nr:hypothetical protein [Bacteroidales bacterium]HNS46773.1 hypothetical protein [Bacteroidales bacterium]